eukprot:19113-Heterococcus_DN1.PRE.1
MQDAPVYCRAALSTLFVITSSFFCSSPCMLIEPLSSRPVMPFRALRLTRLLMVLHAVCTLLKMLSTSCSSVSSKRWHHKEAEI